MPAVIKPNPKAPVIAEIQPESPPSSVRDAFTRAGLGVQSDLGWIWNSRALGERSLEELQQIQRIMKRSTHVEGQA